MIVQPSGTSRCGQTATAKPAREPLSQPVTAARIGPTQRNAPHPEKGPPMSDTDLFADHARSLTSPGTIHVKITPSNTVNIQPRPRVLRILTDGWLVVRDERQTVIAYPVLAGTVESFSAVRVMASGDGHTTTATCVGWL
jgi:hypothetical protein